MRYSRDQLLEIQPLTPNFELVNRLRELRLGVGLPRKRGCRGGRKKLRSIQVVPSRNLHPLMVPPFFQLHPDLQSAVGNAPLSSKHPTQLPTTDCLLSIIPLMGGQPSDAPALSPPSPLQQGGQSSNAPALSPPSPLPQGGQPIALALSPSSPPPQDGQPSDAPGLSPSSSTLLLCPSDSTLSICHLNSQSAVKTGLSGTSPDIAQSCSAQTSEDPSDARGLVDLADDDGNPTEEMNSDASNTEAIDLLSVQELGSQTEKLLSVPRQKQSSPPQSGSVDYDAKSGVIDGISKGQKFVSLKDETNGQPATEESVTRGDEDLGKNTATHDPQSIGSVASRTAGHSDAPTSSEVQPRQISRQTDTLKSSETHTRQTVSQKCFLKTPPFAEGEEHVCEECGQFFALDEHLQAHVITHPAVFMHPGFRCGGCGAKFHEMRNLHTHCDVSRKRKGTRCWRCRQWFSTCDDLYRYRQERVLGHYGFLVARSNRYLRRL
ncbi:hypothetical protein ACOMHN_015577 [Nucella lapillus]